VKTWLEKSAEYFNQIDPAKSEDQELINSKFPSYNFDVIQGAGLTYQIDITKPAGSRIVNLNVNGKALDAAQEVIVVTNNYRASGGGSFAGLNGSQIVYEDPDTNREIIVNYIKAKQVLTRQNNAANRNWSFVKKATVGKVLFQSGYDSLQLAKDDGITNISKDSDKADKSASIYRLMLDM
jgi:2',3'-cyclic-nucleotide 2'-phosphodiesterase/3'-nucleotidase